MSLASLMMKSNFFIKNDFRLDHFLFQFSVQRMYTNEVNFGISRNLKNIFIYLLRQRHTSRKKIILVEKKL